MLIDLHVHTAYSEDFDLPLGEAIEKCREAGIEGLLLAECDTIPPLDEVKAAAEEHDFPVFVGVDVDASDGRCIVVPRDPADERFLAQAWGEDDDDFRVRDVVRVAEEIDAVVIATHPWLDDGGPYLGDRIYDIEGITAIEVLCGVKRHMSNDLALEATNSIGLPGIGGSDTGPEGQRLGRFATAFADEIGSQDELVDALVDGACWAVEISEPRGEMRSRGGRGGRGRGGRGGRR